MTWLFHVLDLFQIIKVYQRFAHFIIICYQHYIDTMATYPLPRVLEEIFNIQNFRNTPYNTSYAEYAQISLSNTFQSINTFLSNVYIKATLFSSTNRFVKIFQRMHLFLRSLLWYASFTILRLSTSITLSLTMGYAHNIPKKVVLSTHFYNLQFIHNVFLGISSKESISIWL